MRSENVVLGKLRNWAEERNDVRAVFLTSSRADTDRTPDALTDYDVQVYVEDTEPFAQDDAWLATFGSIMIRWPLKPAPTFSPDWITQLVLFDDGVRIDFQLTAMKAVDSTSDGAFRVITDKDSLSKNVPAVSTHHSIERPTNQSYESQINAFWWDIVYVAKGLWRGEVNYAKYMLDSAIRFESLKPLMEWYVGTHHGWAIDVGQHGRWFHRYLDGPTWEHYQRTFADASIEGNWSALFETLTFVRRIGQDVAQELGFHYPDDVDTSVSQYILKIRALPAP